MKPSAVITCFEYDDFLNLTLPRTIQHVKPVVVTSPEDEGTQKVCDNYGVTCLQVDARTKRGFVDKGMAIDAAFATLPRDGWQVVMDADIYLPQKLFRWDKYSTDKIYSPHRRMVHRMGEFLGLRDRENLWYHLPTGPEYRNGEYAGYFQLFHWSKLPAEPPWYQTDEWTTYQGSDTVFWRRWMPTGMARMDPSVVLHLGLQRVNWNGRVSRRWDTVT